MWKSNYCQNCFFFVLFFIVVVVVVVFFVFQRIQVEQTFQSTFPNSGLYFFYLENHGADSEEGHVTNLICVVKVTQRNRWVVLKKIIIVLCQHGNGFDRDKLGRFLQIAVYVWDNSFTFNINIWDVWPRSWHRWSRDIKIINQDFQK